MKLKDLLVEKVDPSAKKAAALRKKMTSIRKNIATFKKSLATAKKSKNTDKIEELNTKIAAKTEELTELKSKLETLIGGTETEKKEVVEKASSLEAHKKDRPEVDNDTKDYYGKLHKALDSILASDSTLAPYKMKVRFISNGEDDFNPQISISLGAIQIVGKDHASKLGTPNAKNAYNTWGKNTYSFAVTNPDLQRAIEKACQTSDVDKHIIMKDAKFKSAKDTFIKSVVTKLTSAMKSKKPTDFTSFPQYQTITPITIRLNGKIM
jgi:hypothetical protein